MELFYGENFFVLECCCEDRECLVWGEACVAHMEEVQGDLLEDSDLDKIVQEGEQPLILVFPPSNSL